jgi:hypothetical protein
MPLRHLGRMADSVWIRRNGAGCSATPNGYAVVIAVRDKLWIGRSANPDEHDGRRYQVRCGGPSFLSIVSRRRTRTHELYRPDPRPAGG